MIESEVLARIESQLRQLPPTTLAVVADFNTYLVERQWQSEALAEMLASEAVLQRDWDRPEEEAAWANL